MAEDIPPLANTSLDEKLPVASLHQETLEKQQGFLLPPQHHTPDSVLHLLSSVLPLFSVKYLKVQGETLILEMTGPTRVPTAASSARPAWLPFCRAAPGGLLRLWAGSEKKITGLFGNLSQNIVWGVIPIPKTLVKLPSHIWHAKFILRC